MDKYYSPEEIAEQFSLKPGTVRLWIRQGKLKAVKLGHLWRVPEEALQEFIKWKEEGKKEEGKE